MRFAIFPLHLSKVLRLPQKIDARSYEVLHLSRKIILANLQIWCSKMQPLSGNQRPDLPTALRNMSLVFACHGKCIFADPLQMPHACHRFWNATKPSRFAHFWQCAQSLAPATQNDASTSKVARTCGALTFWLRNVLRATAACTFFDISTSKSAPKLVCLVHLASKCASRHNRVHFFDISTSKSGRGWCGFYSLTWKCASRHNGGQLLIFHLTTWLCTRRYSEPTFRPSGATNHWKNRMFRDFPTFSGTWIFFLRKLSLFDLLSSSLLFSDSSHLCFSSFHIVGSLTSKLHSINYRVKPSNGTFMFTLFSKGSQLKSQMCQLQISQNWQRTQNLNMWGTLSSRGKGLISMHLLDNPKFPNIQQLFSIAFPKFRYLHQDMTWNISCQKKQPTISLRVWGGWTHLKHHKLTPSYSVGWWYAYPTYPSEKYESQLGSFFPIYGKIKNVPNHQPAIIFSILLVILLSGTCDKRWTGR